ncbi:unnamed protein product [Arabidopsis halleri]
MLSRRPVKFRFMSDIHGSFSVGWLALCLASSVSFAVMASFLPE